MIDGLERELGFGIGRGGWRHFRRAGGTRKSFSRDREVIAVDLKADKGIDFLSLGGQRGGADA